MRTLRHIQLGLGKRISYLYGYCKAPIVLFFATGNKTERPLIIGRNPRFHILGQMRVGRNFRVRSVCQRSEFATGPKGQLVIGDDCFINEGARIHAEDLVQLGNRVDIGPFVRIYDTNFHPTRPDEQTKISAVKIEDDVWIGTDVAILPGVTIGRGSVVGSGAIVTKSIPEGSIVVPAPTREVGRFNVPAGFRRR